MNCYFPMPFRTRSRITISSEHLPDQLRAGRRTSRQTAYFHAQWNRNPLTTIGEDFVILDGVRGAGKYVGTYLAIAALERYWWGEGEVKFYIDGDNDWPTVCGSGTEDYAGEHGLFKISYRASTRRSSLSQPPILVIYTTRRRIIPPRSYARSMAPMHGLYRWHLPDPIHFEQELKVTLQQIGHDGQSLFERQDDVASVAYWYQIEPHTPFPQLAAAHQRRPR